MKKVTIRISRDAQAALKGMGERFVKAWKTGKPGNFSVVCLSAPTIQ